MNLKVNIRIPSIFVIRLFVIRHSIPRLHLCLRLPVVDYSFIVLKSAI